jgi:hypothetical protein
MNVGEQGFHHLPFEITRLVDERLVVGNEAEAGMQNFNGSFVHSSFSLAGMAGTIKVLFPVPM